MTAGLTAWRLKHACCNAHPASFNIQHRLLAQSWLLTWMTFARLPSGKRIDTRAIKGTRSGNNRRSATYGDARAPAETMYTALPSTGLPVFTYWQACMQVHSDSRDGMSWYVDSTPSRDTHLKSRTARLQTSAAAQRRHPPRQTGCRHGRR